MSHSPKILIEVQQSEGKRKGPLCPICKKPFGKNKYHNPQFVKWVKKEHPEHKFKDSDLETCFKCMMNFNFQHMGKMKLDILNVRLEK